MKLKLLSGFYALLFVGLLAGCAADQKLAQINL